ncbi:Uncharacterised protein [Vibrio cholerae]|uniref:Uncharacterized protein n=1 Tax=Vibrio cholerae TaxID=666 RepID=A0A655U4P5_VIBCL|nr:Uncharacterised protein [Vibrio cholerae]CSB44132.1 Uncharacterised protein [Vibrio cholerae]CSC33980.1 Uncharacterised protein [Vibrio cholerae]CSD03816.1 Uncharacterised protein [Vibrio cholerae]
MFFSARFPSRSLINPCHSHPICHLLRIIYLHLPKTLSFLGCYCFGKAG